MKLRSSLSERDIKRIQYYLSEVRDKHVSHEEVLEMSSWELTELLSISRTYDKLRAKPLSK